jgi:hypothetical protein
MSGDKWVALAILAAVVCFEVAALWGLREDLRPHAEEVRP